MNRTTRVLRDHVESLQIVDTHEHLLSERLRRRGPGHHDMLPCVDAALLLHHYCGDDLALAGMDAATRAAFFAPDVPADEKWRLLEPHLAAVANTGYIEAVRRSARIVFGEDRFDRAAFLRISERMLDGGHTAPGFTGRMLDAAGVESCQVHSLEAFCFDTARDDGVRVQQDLGVDPLTTRLDLDTAERILRERPATLDDMEGLVDGCFALWSSSAVAVKTLAAYTRPLDVEPADRRAAARAWSRLRAHRLLGAEDRRALENHLLLHCFRRAAEHRLPVKVHCGITAGGEGPGLAAVRDHAVDIEAAVEMLPETTFVLMHMGWPYQEDYVALAKKHRNVVVDLAWAWIVNPQAAVRFVREFLACAPRSGLLGFGGDYTVAECVAGHADMARQGVALALAGLVDDGWIRLEDARDTATLLLRDNAQRVFPSRSQASTLQADIPLGRATA